MNQTMWWYECTHGNAAPVAILARTAFQAAHKYRLKHKLPWERTVEVYGPIGGDSASDSGTILIG